MIATLMLSLAGLAVPPLDGCEPWHGSSGQGLARPPMGMPENTNFSDSFDTYAAGSMISGQGGWETWQDTLGSFGTDAAVVTAQSKSAPHSLNLVPGVPDGSDIVHRFGYTSGKWVVSVWTYVPSGQLSSGYVILMNTYQPTTSYHWSVVIELSSLNGQVLDQVSPGTATAPLVLDQWAEVRCEVDLDADTLMQWYNGVPIGNHPDSYSANWSAGGLKQIQAIDLYSNGVSMYIDSVSITSASCYADCEGDGDLDIFDFLCFQGEYANQTAYADCEQDGDWDIFDFLCFQGAFANGCS